MYAMYEPCPSCGKQRAKVPPPTFACCWRSTCSDAHERRDPKYAAFVREQRRIHENYHDLAHELCRLFPHINGASRNEQQADWLPPILGVESLKREVRRLQSLALATVAVAAIRWLVRQ